MQRSKMSKLRFSSIWLIDRTLLGAPTPDQSGPKSEGNEGVLCLPQSSSITIASTLVCYGLYRTLVGAGGGLTPLQRSSWCMLQTQLTGHFLPWNKISNHQANHCFCPRYNRQNMIVCFKCIIKANPCVIFLIYFFHNLLLNINSISMFLYPICSTFNFSVLYFNFHISS